MDNFITYTSITSEGEISIESHRGWQSTHQENEVSPKSITEYDNFDEIADMLSDSWFSEEVYRR